MQTLVGRLGISFVLVLLVLLVLTAGAWRRTQPGTPATRQGRTS